MSYWSEVMRKFGEVLISNDRRDEEQFIKELIETPKTFSQTVVFILNARPTTTTTKRQREEALIVFSYAVRYHPDAMQNCMKETSFECDNITDGIVHALDADDSSTTMLFLFLLNSEIAHVLVRDRVPLVVDTLIKLLNVSKDQQSLLLLHHLPPLPQQ